MLNTGAKSGMYADMHIVVLQKEHQQVTLHYCNFLLASSAVTPSNGIPDLFPTIPCRLIIS